MILQHGRSPARPRCFRFNGISCPIPPTPPTQDLKEVPAPKQCQYCPCLCEGVARRRRETPSHKHGLCPPFGFQLEGKVQRWGVRVWGSGFGVQAGFGFRQGSGCRGFRPELQNTFGASRARTGDPHPPLLPVEGPRDPGPKSRRKRRGGGGAAGASHDSPRAQTCTFKGPGLQKQLQNSTRRPPREGRMNENGERETEKKARNFRPPTLRGRTLRGPP